MSSMPVSHLQLQQKACRVLLERGVIAVTRQDEGGIPGRDCKHARLTPVLMSRYCGHYTSESSTHRELTAPTSECRFWVAGANKQEALIDFLKPETSRPYCTCLALPAKSR